MWLIDKLIYATTKAKKREQYEEELQYKILRAETNEEIDELLTGYGNHMLDYAMQLEFSLTCTILALLIVVVSFFMGVWL